MGSRFRLFVLLGLLVPLFAGLQYLIAESVPRVEIRFVAQDAPAAEPAPAPAERVVERVVYVPVERSETAQLSDSSAGLPAADKAVEPVKIPVLSGVDAPASAPRRDVDLESEHEDVAAPAPASPVQPEDAPTEHMGLLAVVTPVAEPVVAAAPAARVVPRRVEAPVVQPASEPAEADDLPESEPVAEQPVQDEAHPWEVAEIQVIDTTIEADQSTRVVSYRIPVQSEAETPVDAPVVADVPDDPKLDADEGDTAEPASDAELARAPSTDEPPIDAPAAAHADDNVAEVQVLETVLDSNQTSRVLSYRVPVQPEAPASQDESDPASADVHGDANDDEDAAAQ